MYVENRGRRDNVWKYKAELILLKEANRQQVQGNVKGHRH